MFCPTVVDWIQMQVLYSKLNAGLQLIVEARVLGRQNSCICHLREVEVSGCSCPTFKNACQYYQPVTNSLQKFFIYLLFYEFCIYRAVLIRFCFPSWDQDSYGHLSLGLFDAQSLIKNASQWMCAADGVSEWRREVAE